MSPTNSEAWRWRRLGYYTLLTIWFAAIAFYFGPNRILFGKWTWITPADFTEIARTSGVASATAGLAFRHEHGRWPQTADEIRMVGLRAGTFADFRDDEMWIYCFSKWNHRIVYHFTEPRGWSVSGSFTRGPIPNVPLIDVSPDTQPSTAEAP